MILRSSTGDQHTRARPTGAVTPTAAGAALVCGFIAVSLTSRVPFSQIGPLAPISSFGSTVVTVLGVLPPALMGICAPLTPVVRRRLGDDATLVIASTILLVGCVIRPFGLIGLVIGTAVAAAAIALINVAIPVVVSTRFPARKTGVMMGVYAVAMGAGSALVAALMVPVAHATGSWQPAIAVAIIPACVAVAAIAPQWHRGGASTRPQPATSATVTHKHPHRTRLGWSLLCFFGIQTLVFYAVLAWLSSILVADGTSVGIAAVAQSSFIVGMGCGGFIAPALAGRRSDQRIHILATIAVCAIGLIGVLAIHGSGAVAAAFVLGAGLGGGQSLPGVLFAHRGQSPDHVAALSTFAQTGGYLLAATGPLLLPAVHAVTHSWHAPLLVLLALLAANSVLAIRAGHDGAGHDRGTRSTPSTPLTNRGTEHHQRHPLSPTVRTVRAALVGLGTQRLTSTMGDAHRGPATARKATEDLAFRRAWEPSSPKCR